MLKKEIYIAAGIFCLVFAGAMNFGWATERHGIMALLYLAGFRWIYKAGNS